MSSNECSAQTIKIIHQNLIKMKIRFNAITVDSTDENQFKPELFQAQLRQVVTSCYPSRVADSGGLFSEDEYGLEEQTFDSNRVTWIDIPHGQTVEQVEERLRAFQNARIRRTLALKPIIDARHANAIARGLITKEQVAERQTVRNSEGEPILYDGKVQYKKLTFLANGGDDIDLRPPIQVPAEAAAAAAVEAQVELSTTTD